MRGIGQSPTGREAVADSGKGSSITLRLVHEAEISNTVSGSVQVAGRGISGSWSQAGYRCGTSSTWPSYIEIYEDDTSHDWPWPDYRLQSGDTFSLQAGHTYDFRGPSVVGAMPLSFSLQLAGNTDLELRATPCYRSGY